MAKTNKVLVPDFCSKCYKYVCFLLQSHNRPKRQIITPFHGWENGGCIKYSRKMRG